MRLVVYLGKHPKILRSDADTVITNAHVDKLLQDNYVTTSYATLNIIIASVRARTLLVPFAMQQRHYYFMQTYLSNFGPSQSLTQAISTI